MRGRFFRFCSWLLGMLGLVLGRANAETLTLATYNVENYTLADRMTPEGYRLQYPKPEVAKTALRSVMRGLNADILILQEMGGRSFLEELRRDLAAEGLSYAFAEILEAGDEPRYVAILSRRPFARVVKHTDLQFPYFGGIESVKRGLLEVVLNADGRELTLFALHLKSRITDRPDDAMSALRRANEAEVIRDRILTRFPQPDRARFLVVGDCNEGQDSRPVKALLGGDSFVLTHLVPAADARGESWTHRYRAEGTYSRVDHFLIAPEPSLQRAVTERGARIFEGDEVAAASDHRPVLLKLDFSAKP